MLPKEFVSIIKTITSQEQFDQLEKVMFNPLSKTINIVQSNISLSEFFEYCDLV